MDGVADAAWPLVATGLLALGAWIAWIATRAPRCPRCGARTEPRPAELLERTPPVFRVGFRCPRCDAIVDHRVMGVWD